MTSVALSYVSAKAFGVMPFQAELGKYGVDWDGSLPEEPCDISVEVPETQMLLSDEGFQRP